MEAVGKLGSEIAKWIVFCVLQITIRQFFTMGQSAFSMVNAVYIVRYLQILPNVKVHFLVEQTILVEERLIDTTLVMVVGDCAIKERPNHGTSDSV